MRRDYGTEKNTRIRLPKNLYAAIEKRAQVRLRSANSEMIALLKIGMVSKADEVEALEAADKLTASFESKEPKEDATG